MFEWRNYMIALSWLSLIIFFTYTTVLSSAFIVNMSFFNEYFEYHNHLISMIVNFGLIVMVVFDFSSAGKQVSNTDLFLLSLGFICAVGIYGHSLIVCNDELDSYTFPLSNPNFSYILHAFILAIIWYLKVKSLSLEANSKSVIVNIVD